MRELLKTLNIRIHFHLILKGISCLTVCINSKHAGTSGTNKSFGLWIWQPQHHPYWLLKAWFLTNMTGASQQPQSLIARLSVLGWSWKIHSNVGSVLPCLTPHISVSGAAAPHTSHRAGLAALLISGKHHAAEFQTWQGNTPTSKLNLLPSDIKCWISILNPVLQDGALFHTHSAVP